MCIGAKKRRPWTTLLDVCRLEIGIVVNKTGIVRALVCLFGMTAVVGCASLGPRVVATERYQYNLAMQSAEDQQLLLNLVRLRYRDRPYFLETSSLATQFSIAPQAGLIGALGSPAIEQDLLVSGSVGLEAQPTVSYVPLQGEEFAKRMLRPIPAEHLVLLANSGWSIERILRLVVHRINGVVNAPTAAGPTPDAAPEFEDFLRVARLLRTLQQSRGIEFGFDAARKVPLLHVTAEGAASSTFEELAELLGLQAQARTFEIACELQSPCRDFNVQMRSMTGVLNFVAQAVQVSAADQDAGLVTLTRDERGDLFDWQQVTQDLFRVEVSAEPPSAAAVSVKYRDQWFFVADSDLHSKSTLMLIGQLFSLVAVEGQSDSPLLTLPLGN